MAFAALAALAARAAVVVRGVAAGTQTATAAARAAQATNAARTGYRAAQEATHAAEVARAAGKDKSLSTLFNQAKGALAHANRSGSFESYELAARKFGEVAQKLSGFAKALTGGIVGLLLLPKVVKTVANAMLEYQRPLAEVNGNIAATYARLGAQRFQRTTRLAGMTSGSTAILARETSRLEEKLLPYAATAINLLNKFIALNERALVIGMTIVEKVSPFVPGLAQVKEAIQKLNEEEKKSSQGLVQFSRDLAAGGLSGRRWKKP